MGKIKYVSLLFFSLLFILVLGVSVVRAEDPTITPTPSGPTPTPDNSSQISSLQNQIKEYQGKIADLQSQGKTFTSQIKIMDSQIHLTELQIDAAREKIAVLEGDIMTAKKQIVNLENNINESTKALMGRVAATYQVGKINPWQMLLTSSNISNFLTRLTYLKVVQTSDKRNLYAAEQSRSDYAHEKNLLESKQEEAEAAQKQLEDYTVQLAQDKAAKQTLLAQTKGDEAKYQKLLQQAQAQISAFKSFATFAGGASILPAQASPDGWYYNQRDERWGNNAIGASGESVWQVGCLVTATAMIRKQRGENITPADVARESSFFFSSTAMMLIPWNGGRFTSQGRDTGAIDSKLAAGTPIIVGLNAGPYGTHFIVLKSGSNGDYIMNDPWYGPDMKFTDHYSAGQIFQYGWYNG